MDDVSATDPRKSANIRMLGKGTPPPPNDEEQSVSKANEAIAIRPKRGKLTLLSRRIYNALLFHAQQQGVDQPAHTILLSELVGDARFNSNNTELLKSHIRDMQATTIEWHTSGAGCQSWTSTQLLGPVRIDEPGRGQACSITWSFPEPIREKLVRPSQYTRILLEVSSQMRSYAAAVLYELGARYLTSPAKLTMREDIVWWASVLTGRSDITVVDYRILHRDTIKKALAELEALSEDFRMEVVEHKRGRRVEELQFRIIPKSHEERSGLRDGACDVFDLQLVERIVAIGLRRADAQDLYAVTDEGVLRAAVDHVEQRMKNPALPSLKSCGAYLKNALKKHYAGTAAATRNERSPPKAPSMQEKLERLREAWMHHKAMEARRLFEDMPDRQRAELLGRFEGERLPGLATPIARAWQRDGTAGKIAGSLFFRWMATITWPGEVTDKELLEFAISQS
jgi:hypothetical protein